MKQLLSGAALAAFVSVAAPVLAQAPMTPSSPAAAPAASPPADATQAAPATPTAAPPPPPGAAAASETATTPTQRPRRPVRHRTYARGTRDSIANRLNAEEANRLRTPAAGAAMYAAQPGYPAYPPAYYPPPYPPPAFYPAPWVYPRPWFRPWRYRAWGWPYY